EFSASQSVSLPTAEPSPPSYSSHKCSSAHRGLAEIHLPPPTPRGTDSAAYTWSKPASARTHPTRSHQSSAVILPAGSPSPGRSPVVLAVPAVAGPSRRP